MTTKLKAFGLTLLMMLVCILIMLGIMNYPNEFTYGIVIATFVTMFVGVFIAIRDSLE